MRGDGASTGGALSKPDAVPIVVVLGMHRSGTSLCSQMLHMIGVDMASEEGANTSNPLGHYERWEIMKLQDEVLELFDRAYFSPTHDFPLPPAWWTDFRIRPIKEKIKEVLKPLVPESGLFGFKDPRTARLLPFWKQVFAELGLEPRFVLCLRDPAHIGVSLHARDMLDPQTGELRALSYTVDAIRYTRGKPRCFIRYADWTVDPMINIEKLTTFLGINMDMDYQDVRFAATAIFKPEMNRSEKLATTSRLPVVRTFFDMLDCFVETEGAPEIEQKIDYFISNFVAFRQLLGPFERELSAAIKQRASTQDELVAAQGAAEELRDAHSDVLGRVRHAEHALAEQGRRLESERVDSARLRKAYEAAAEKARQAEENLKGRAIQISGLTDALCAAERERDRAAEAQALLDRRLSETQQLLDQARAGRRGWFR